MLAQALLGDERSAYVNTGAALATSGAAVLALALPSNERHRQHLATGGAAVLARAPLGNGAVRSR